MEDLHYYETVAMCLGSAILDLKISRSRFRGESLLAYCDFKIKNFEAALSVTKKKIEELKND